MFPLCSNVERGTPRRLAERDRRLLARYFGVPEEALGGPASEAGIGEMVAVPRLDVGVSAGPGALPGAERGTGHIAFDPAWLRRIAADPARPLIRVEGDSMAPTLGNGDEILVDPGDAAERLRDGIYVLRIDEALMVKRIARSPLADASPSAATIRTGRTGPIATPPGCTSSGGWSGPGGGSAS